MRHIFRFVTAVVAGAAIVSTVPGAAAAAPGRSSSDPGGVPGVAVPVLDWQDCGDGFQCTGADVPVDYRDPGGAKITLQLRRSPAADQEHKIGSLFLHAGGPGSSAWDWVGSFAPSSPQEMRDKFDIIGFDPRGVGRSGPVECLDLASYREQWARATTRVTPASFHTAWSTAGEFTAACQQKSGALLPFLGTAATARDLDVLRAAVGDEKLTYFGNSFGSYVGTVYANMFPLKTRALILDGAYDPIKYAQDPYAYDYGQYKATDDAMRRFLAWCSATPAQCAFAGGDLDAKVHAIMDDLDANPVRDANGAVTVNGATMLSDLTFRLNSGTRRWSSLGTDLQNAVSRTGSLMYEIPEGDNTFNAANVSIECADRIYPSSTAELAWRLSTAARDFPLTAPGMAYGPPAYDQTHAPSCVRWPAERLTRYTGKSFAARGAAPILIFGNTGDPDTPYADAVALEKILTSARLITWEGEGHTARRKSACTEVYMYDYLINLTVPPAGTVCSDAPIPA